MGSCPRPFGNLAGSVAGVLEEPGRVRPIASMALDMVFAVYMPPQAPGPGHACCSKSSNISSLVRDGSSGLLKVL